MHSRTSLEVSGLHCALVQTGTIGVWRLSPEHVSVAIGRGNGRLDSMRTRGNCSVGVEVNRTLGSWFGAAVLPSLEVSPEAANG